MLLGKFQVFRSQAFGTQMFIGLSVISQDGGNLRRGKEILIASPVFRGQFFAAVQLPFQFFCVHGSHFQGQGVGDGLKAGFRQRCCIGCGSHHLGVGQKYLHGFTEG